MSQDDIFSEESSFETKKTVDIESLGTLFFSNEKTVKVKPKTVAKIPNLLGSDYPKEFLNMVELVRSKYEEFPSLNYEELYEELSSLSVNVSESPTLQHINLQLQKLQSIKERVSEITALVLRSHGNKKRYVALLQEAWMKYSSETSADKRKADSAYRMSEFELDFLAVDALFKTSSHIAKNIETTQEILSRRITIAGLQIKMLDLGRNSVPDYEFNDGGSLDDLTKKDDEVLEAEEGSF